MEPTGFSWLKFNQILLLIKRTRWTDLKITKFLLTILTTIFTITGLIFLIEGIQFLAECNKYEMFVPDSIFVVPRFTIATAVFIFFIAILGFYGAKSEKYKFVLAFVVLLVPILVFEIAITVLAFEVLEDIYFAIQSQMRLAINLWYSSMAAWDNLHRELECCGWYRPDDQLPISCCRIPDGARSPFECTTTNSFNSRCEDELFMIMSNNAYSVGITGALVTCLQGIIIGVAAWIAYRLKHKQEIPFSEYVNRSSQKIVQPGPVVVDYSKY